MQPKWTKTDTQWWMRRTTSPTLTQIIRDHPGPDCPCEDCQLVIGTHAIGGRSYIANMR